MVNWISTFCWVMRRGPSEGVRQEPWVPLCLYRALRTLIKTVVTVGLDPARISLPILNTLKNSVRRAFSR